MEVCRQMLELRGRLDALGVAWEDYSEEWSTPVSMVHIERTRFKGLLGEVSVIWGYERSTMQGRYWAQRAHWVTCRVPIKLECWYEPYDEDPVPMTVDEILSATLGVGDEARG